jgi:hypothetical protein
MNIYTKPTYHRKIYKEHHGPIPKDANGRSYEIHHIDGNHLNNNISNLKCVSIEEHYKIHKSQGDIKACLIMAKRMKLSPEEKTQLAKIANAGSNNPSYGTMWINNGSENLKIKQTDIIPAGWKKGRYFDEKLQKTFVSRSKIGKNNPRYDTTLYIFQNEQTEEEYNMTSYDFSEKLELRRKVIRALAQGKRESYKGWRIVRDYSEI